jgi:hypothetical protein
MGALSFAAASPLAFARRAAGRPDALALPAVSYRGLWDKFDGPGTLGAFRRAYRRGVPSLVRVGPGAPVLGQVLDALCDPAVNRHQLPLYLLADALPDAALVAGAWAAGLGVFAVQRGPRADRPWPIHSPAASGWREAGTYVPIGAGLDALTHATIRGPVVLFESNNVVTSLGCLEIRSDDAVLETIRTVVAAGAAIVRVSDMVELDQLDLRTREAC